MGVDTDTNTLLHLLNAYFLYVPNVVFAAVFAWSQSFHCLYPLKKCSGEGCTTTLQNAIDHKVGLSPL